MNAEYDEAQLEIVKKARLRAMKILEYMDRTEHQLREKLKEGDFPPFAIDDAVEYVRSFHYIDDARYAEFFVLRKKTEKSLYEIRQELLKRGVAEEHIQAALLNEPVDEKEAIKNLFIKKYRRKDLDDPKTFEKAFRYFGNKGFRYGDMKAAFQDAVTEIQNESSGTL